MSSPYRRPHAQSANEPPADIDDDSSAILQLKEVSKSFGPVNVIDRVSINVRPGQVHALLGENGAGKSTLIKMMSGVYQPDSGAIIIDGKQTHLPTSKAAEDLGIATIHQELNLVPTMTVAENVMLGQPPQIRCPSPGSFRSHRRGCKTQRSHRQPGDCPTANGGNC